MRNLSFLFRTLIKYTITIQFLIDRKEHAHDILKYWFLPRRTQKARSIIYGYTVSALSVVKA